MGDLGLFSQGLETIADILVGVKFDEDIHSAPLLSANDQMRATIVGLVSLINSAQELLKSNDISKDEYAMLLSATFSRHITMEMCSDLFRSSMYHSLVVMGTENAKIGKGIIFHCVRNLAPFKACYDMASQPGTVGVGVIARSRAKWQKDGCVYHAVTRLLVLWETVPTIPMESVPIR